eukprot:474267_1
MAKCTVSISLSFVVFIITSFLGLVPCVGQDVCITGYYDLNGVYGYYGYDYTNQGAQYYNSDTGYYLHPFILNGYYQWIIGDDYTTNYAYAFAQLSPTPSPTYVFDVEDGNGLWKVYTSEWYSQPGMLVEPCTPTPSPTPAPTPSPTPSPAATSCVASWGAVGDGYCQDDLNIAECNWDGGDCCEETCVDAAYTCFGSFSDCLDPDYAPTTSTTPSPTTSASCETVFVNEDDSFWSCDEECEGYGSCSWTTHLSDQSLCECCYCSGTTTTTTTSSPSLVGESDYSWIYYVLGILVVLCILSACYKKYQELEHQKNVEIMISQTRKASENQINQYPTEGIVRSQSPMTDSSDHPTQSYAQSPMGVHVVSYPAAAPMQQQMMHAVPTQAAAPMQHQQSIPMVHAPMRYQQSIPMHHQQSIPMMQPQSTLPKGWRRAISPDGRVYYQNDITQKTQWHVPTSTENTAKPLNSDEKDQNAPEYKTEAEGVKSEQIQLYQLIEFHKNFMKTHEKTVDQIIASSPTTRHVEQLRAAKKTALKKEEDILKGLMNATSMNQFLKDIILVENLFNKVYTAEQRDKQRNARASYAPNIKKYESKPKPCSMADSFMGLDFYAGTTKSAFKKWIEAVTKECEDRKIQITSKSDAKKKDIERAFYKSFYVYGRGDGYQQMTDMLRCSFSFKEFKDLYKCFDIIEKKMQDHGGILRCKDRFDKKDMPFGYRDLLINIHCPGSDQKVVCEVQLHHQIFYQYKETSHKVYKRARIFDKKGTNVAYEYSNEISRKIVGDKCHPDGDNVSKARVRQLLKEWSLDIDQYVDNLREDGWEDPDDWINLDEEGLLKMTFKPGHAQKFLRLVKKREKDKME